MFAYGVLYGISKDLAEYIVKSPIPLTVQADISKYPQEDKSVGYALSSLHIERQVNKLNKKTKQNKTKQKKAKQNKTKKQNKKYNKTGKMTSESCSSRKQVSQPLQEHAILQ